MPATPAPLAVRRDNNKIFSHVRNKWLDETPEEAVRQDYLCILVNQYGYTLDQIAEEVSTPGPRGNRHARADLVIWRTAQDKRDGKTALIVVECKADNVAIDNATYEQGANYANYERAKFFVAHNRRATKFFKVDLALRAPNYAEVKDIPRADASDRDIQELLDQLKPFEGKEFADLLHQCHNIIRNNEHLDPAAAFDEIAKILFIKVMVERRLRERRGRQNLFTVEWLKTQIAASPIDALFEETKQTYRADKIFADDERINLRPATVENIVRKLEGYNLSDTSEDIKGIAFERFLGGTFRGEIGQFFTPRPIVEFVVRMLDPREDERICDPASGSGGFLIRCFEIIREAIAADVDKQYRDFCKTLDARKNLTAAAKAKARREKYQQLQEQLDPYSDPDRRDPHKSRSRIWKLSNLCIYGTDANDRMARTSKMNMIMHGDGHGGVHHHNGLLNVNGIFENRFHVIATNPPFGASVTRGNTILAGDYEVTPEARRAYRAEHGSAYDTAVARVESAAGRPILDLFKLPRSQGIKTEILFIERCLDLLVPGGRLGIVLPEGIFNNPSLQYVREFVEDRARLLAVVSLSQDTFKSSGASVKCSILFLQKHTEQETARHAAELEKARQEITAKHRPAIAAEHARLQAAIAATVAQTAKSASEKFAKPADLAVCATSAAAPAGNAAALRKELAAYDKQMAETIATETRALLKQRLDYPVFLYEAEHVGITATGEPGPNELYPNDNKPAGLEKTCLELYQEFRHSPDDFFAPGPAA